MKTLWSGSGATHRDVLGYTVSDDRDWDARLLSWDILGSLGHIEGLRAAKLLSGGDYARLRAGLRRALRSHQAGRLRIGREHEDAHSAVEAWLTKRQLSEKVTNPQVDALYEDARAAGAIGGKLLGAGGGGFMVLLVPPERQEDVRRRLNRLIHVPFEFEFSGSQIIFFDPEQDYAEHDRRRAEQDIEAFREIE